MNNTEKVNRILNDPKILQHRFDEAKRQLGGSIKRVIEHFTAKRDTVMLNAMRDNTIQFSAPRKVVTGRQVASHF